MYLDGDKYRVWVGADGAADNLHYELAGQLASRLVMARGAIDQTVKADDWQRQRPGLGSITFSTDYKPTLPDANGHAVVETAFKTKARLSVQIRKDGSAGVTEDVVFAIAAYVASLSPEFPTKSDVPSKIDWMPDGAPSVNQLAA